MHGAYPSMSLAHPGTPWHTLPLPPLQVLPKLAKLLLHFSELCRVLQVQAPHAAHGLLQLPDDPLHAASFLCAASLLLHMPRGRAMQGACHGTAGVLCRERATALQGCLALLVARPLGHGPRSSLLGLHVGPVPPRPLRCEARHDAMP